MIDIRPAASRFTADHGWLRSSFSFSFAEYFDPNNMSFGPMRVLNDDFVEGRKGFGRHPHKEMEIVSLVLKGQLEHQDSTGQRAVTTFGEVQRMSAGTGVYHSEMNPGEEEVNFLQMWFHPEKSGLAPSYETTRYDTAKMKNALLPVVSKQSGEEIAHIHQDLTIYLSELEGGQSLTFRQAEGRRIFVFVLEGNLELNGGEFRLERRDSARITEMPELELTSGNGSRFVLIDLP